MGMTWSQVKAFAQKLDNALERAVQEHEADVGTRFFHESDFTEARFVRVSLEDGKYSLRHGAGFVRRAFSRAGFTAYGEDLFSTVETDYSNPRLEEFILQDFLELASASLPIDGRFRASCWLVATRLGIEVSVGEVSYVEALGVHRIEGQFGERSFRIDLTPHFAETARGPELKKHLIEEFKDIGGLLRVGRRY
jgi:hypothetical protein